MMVLEDFKDKHKGEEVIVVCNGPGLLNIPFAFLRSRPIFTLNYFAYWVPFIQPDYWLVLDPLCFRGVKGETVKKATTFIKGHQKQAYIQASKEYLGTFYEDSTVFYKMEDRIPGFTYTEEWGTKYSTSAIAAAHLGEYMGASKVLLVGFNCTYGMALYDNIYEFEGKSKIPHFYDDRDHFWGYSELWDSAMARFRDWAAERGTEVINLSIPTESKYIERQDYRLYWQPEGELERV